jgi:hypothetical protein
VMQVPGLDSPDPVVHSAALLASIGIGIACVGLVGAALAVEKGAARAYKVGAGLGAMAAAAGGSMLFWRHGG